MIEKPLQAGSGVLVTPADHGDLGVERCGGQGIGSPRYGSRAIGPSAQRHGEPIGIKPELLTQLSTFLIRGWWLNERGVNRKPKLVHPPSGDTCPAASVDRPWGGDDDRVNVAAHP